MIFFKKPEASPSPPRIDRITKTPTDELVRWGEVMVMHLGKAFDDWRYHDVPLTEALELARTLSAVLEEVQDRLDRTPTAS